METITLEASEELRHQERLGQFVWEELCDEVTEGVRTLVEAQAFYDEWFPSIPHAA